MLRSLFLCILGIGSVDSLAWSEETDDQIEAVIVAEEGQREKLPVAQEARTQGPPQPARFLDDNTIWWGDLSVSMPNINGHWSPPLLFGYIGIVRNPMTLSRMPDPSTGKIKDGFFLVLRLSPFGLTPFRSQLEDQGGGFVRGMMEQMNALRQLSNPSQPLVSIRETQSVIKGLLNEKFSGTENASAIVRNYEGGYCKQAICISLGKMDDPTTIPFAPTRQFQASESLKLKYQAKDSGVSWIFRTFTYRGGLNEQGLPQSYISSILNPPATRRNKDGTLAEPRPFGFIDYRFDSYEGAVSLTPKSASVLERLKIFEISAALGKARGERFSVANIVSRVGKTSVYLQFGEESYMRADRESKKPTLKRFSATSLTPFRNGNVDMSLGYSQISVNGQGLGVPFSSKMVSAVSTQNISPKIGPGKFFVREFAGVAKSAQQPTNVIATGMIGFRW